MFNNLDTRSVTFNLIAINVLLFFASAIIPPLNNLLSLHYIFNKHGFLEQLYTAGNDMVSLYPNLYSFAQGAYYYRQAGEFMPFQIITHMFMHGSLTHIFFNMFGLFMFGYTLERVWGARRYMVFYFVTGFGAVVLHMIVQALLVYQAAGSVDPTMALLEANPDAWGTYFSSSLGASGALFGLLTAFALLFPNTEMYLMFVPVPIKAKYLVGVYILMELYLGFTMHGADNVGHFAHLGGALFGFLLVKYWNKNRNSLY